VKMSRSPRIHDRVLLTLCCFGVIAIACCAFLGHADNRLVNGVALPLWHAPLLETATVIFCLVALALLSLTPHIKARSVATLLVGAALFWSCLSGAGLLADRLAQAGLPAARISLGPAFWILIAVAFLAMLDAAQRGRFSLSARIAIGAALTGGFAVMADIGCFSNLTLAKEFFNHRAMFMRELGRHLSLVGAAIAFALILSIPLTAFVLRHAPARSPVFASLGVVQTIPSIALFGVLIAPLSALSAHWPLLADLGIGGIGPAPAIIALTLYSLPPLVRSFYTGFTEVAADVKDAALGIGFDSRALFLRVELPLAMPAFISGLRVVAIQAIGLAAVAALIGAGGLGVFVFQGIGQYALELVLVGAIPIILLALAADFVFQMLLAAARRRTSSESGEEIARSEA
jgi:osmoprotectant transport system permease protein